jgi:hypothetical protein
LRRSSAIESLLYNASRCRPPRARSVFLPILPPRRRLHDFICVCNDHGHRVCYGTLSVVSASMSLPCRGIRYNPKSVLSQKANTLCHASSCYLWRQRASCCRDHTRAHGVVTRPGLWLIVVNITVIRREARGYRLEYVWIVFHYVPSSRRSPKRAPFADEHCGNTVSAPCGASVTCGIRRSVRVAQPPSMPPGAKVCSAVGFMQAKQMRQARHGGCNQALAAPDEFIAPGIQLGQRVAREGLQE